MQDYASLSRRFLAFILDAIILAIPSLIALALMPVLGGILVWLFYAPVFESSELGATIGKNLMGIKVADLNGQRVTFRAALIRNVLKMPSTAFLMVGAVFAFFTEKKQTLHDLIADTTVIYGRSELPFFDTWLNHLKSLFSQLKDGGSASFDKLPTGRSSTVDELERLENLRAKGALSDEEFLKAKRKILAD
jgi:uncharacterized RDD family membrane protein YckC